MKYSAILLVFLLKLIQVENRMLPIQYVRATTQNPDFDPPIDENPDETAIKVDNIAADGPEIDDESSSEKVIGLRPNDEKEAENLGYNLEKKRRVVERPKEPCAIVVLSNIQNPNMQSLLRKYRYDAKGALIPSSVKYFIKLPQGLGSSPLLVPLNDKAFSHLGGFVRYYKEVPPIPQAW